MSASLANSLVFIAGAPELVPLVFFPFCPPPQALCKFPRKFIVLLLLLRLLFRCVVCFVAVFLWSRHGYARALVTPFRAAFSTILTFWSFFVQRLPGSA